MRTSGTLSRPRGRHPFKGRLLQFGASGTHSLFGALFAGNVRAPFLLVAALAPGMVARGKGSIVNIGSMAGELGLAGGAAYGATKAALSSMTRAWAAEFSASGVRVNLVAPGPVHTRGEQPVADLIQHLGTTTAMRATLRALSSPRDRATT